MAAVKKALVLFGKSKYNIHVYAAERTSEILKRDGYDVTYVNTTATDDKDMLQYFMQNEHPDYVVTFDCSGFDLELLGDDLFLNSLCCPMAHIILTNPVELTDYLNKRMNFVMELYMHYKADIDFTRNYFPRVPAVNVFGNHITSYTCENTKRDIDILIPSTYCPPEVIKAQIDQLPQVFAHICNELIRICIDLPGSDVYVLMADHLKNLGFNASREDMISIMSLTVPIMNYVKMYFVDKITRELVESGLCVTVCGDGWEDSEFKQCELFQSLGPVEFSKLTEYMQRSVIVINNQAHRSGGIHERVFMAMAAGAHCITDVASDKADTLIHMYRNYNEIPDIAKNVLEKY